MLCYLAPYVLCPGVYRRNRGFISRLQPPPPCNTNGAHPSCLVHPPPNSDGAVPRERPSPKASAPIVGNGSQSPSSPNMNDGPEPTLHSHWTTLSLSPFHAPIHSPPLLLFQPTRRTIAMTCHPSDRTTSQLRASTSRPVHRSWQPYYKNMGRILGEEWMWETKRTVMRKKVVGRMGVKRIGVRRME